MQSVSAETYLQAALAASIVTVMTLFANPVSDIWVHSDQLTPNDASELWWITTMVALGAPAFGGLLSGIVLGRDERRHRKPFLRGGLSATGGLVLGVSLWAGLGGVVHSIEELFASTVLGLAFIVVGVPVAFLTGGYVTKTTVWG